MTGLEESLLRILSGHPFQLLLAVHLFAFPTFRRRGHFWLRFLLTALPVLLSFELVFHLAPGGLFPNNPFSDRLFLLIPTAWYFVLLRLCYVCTPREALFSTSCALVLQHAVFNLFWIIKTLGAFPEYSLTALLVTWGLMLLLYGTTLAVMWKWMEDREGHTLPKHRVLQNALVICAYVTFFARRSTGADFDIYPYLANVLAAFLAMGIQIGLLHETELALRSEVVGQLLAAEQKKQRLTAENIEIINRKCHDLKHQIEGLRRMKSEAERDAYIGQVEDAVLFYESAAKTGNETLDLILMDKQLYCKAHDITLTCVCDGEDLKRLDTMDLYALFGNALDNAIESVSSEAPENRIISFRTGRRGAFLSIHFENYLGHAVQMQDGLPITTKNEQNYHGFGMLSIRHIVEKYGGTMSVRTDQNLFRLDILLPCAET